MNRIQSIELFYAFDIHSNSFVPLYFFTNTLIFILLPIISYDNYFTMILCNFIFCVGFFMYSLNTITGYMSKNY